MKIEEKQRHSDYTPREVEAARRVMIELWNFIARDACEQVRTFLSMLNIE